MSSVCSRLLLISSKTGMQRNFDRTASGCCSTNTETANLSWATKGSCDQKGWFLSLSFLFIFLCDMWYMCLQCTWRILPVDQVPRASFGTRSLALGTKPLISGMKNSMWFVHHDLPHSRAWTVLRSCLAERKAMESRSALVMPRPRHDSWGRQICWEEEQVGPWAQSWVEVEQQRRKRPDVLPAEEVAVASFLPSFSNICCFFCRVV